MREWKQLDELRTETNCGPFFLIVGEYEPDEDFPEPMMFWELRDKYNKQTDFGEGFDPMPMEQAQNKALHAVRRMFERWVD